MIAANIGYSGLQASVTRLNASAQNVANANTTGETPKAVAAASAAGRVANSAYQPVMVYQAAVAGGGVNARPVPAVPGVTNRYDPDSRDADENGMVAAPDVDYAAEDAEQRKALSAYRANLAVIRTANQMEGTLVDRRA